MNPRASKVTDGWRPCPPCIAHLVEEIKALGRQERRELENRLGVLIGHLLKWDYRDYQPQKPRKSWRITIPEQRRAVEKLQSSVLLDAGDR